jgi:hypothetical protein
MVRGPQIAMEEAFDEKNDRGGTGVRGGVWDRAVLEWRYLLANCSRDCAHLESGFLAAGTFREPARGPTTL